MSYSVFYIVSAAILFLFFQLDFLVSVFYAGGFPVNFKLSLASDSFLINY